MTMPGSSLQGHPAGHERQGSNQTIEFVDADLGEVLTMILTDENGNFSYEPDSRW